MFFAKDIALVTLHSIHCEKFYITVEEAETICILYMKNRNYPKCYGNLCKNLKLANQSFSKMSACGLFYIDATLPMYLVENRHEKASSRSKLIG
ncbi:hypothetical protein PYW08_009407 [Mythimna loreyi]|uniref:Uncharacterized protein n=1 Tax=Mythimna loreyi TaxID=667449 RepID=A0ACC2QDF7_9NEOP|nr:hypothetical protein PYW08_009407 [Mythimna loreyi]